MERSHAVVNGLTRSLSRSEDDVDRQDFKLLIDPAIKKGHAKIFRYNGVFPGQPPVIPRDPRSRRTRIWTLNKADLPVPNFKVDDCYVGIPPQREVLFSALNDNVDKKFLQQMCERYGRIDAIKIYFDPQTKKHTGKGRVTFSTTTAAKMAVAKLNHTSVMGNIIKAQIEPNSKVLEAHGMSQRGSEHPPPRRSSGHESGTIASTVLPPAGVSRSLGHLSTPPPSVISQSPSTDSSVSSPSLLLMRSSAASVRLPADIWSTSFSNSWDRTTASANKVSQAGTAFLSPQSISSGQSGFEPVLPPHSFQRNEEPPPPPPPSLKPPPPPVDRGSSKDPPPPPPDEKLLPSSSYMKFEDISPDPVFSPEDEGKIPQSTSLSKEKTNDKAVSKVCSRDAVHNLSPPSKVHSPRSDRSEGHKNWEKKKLHEREERNRDKYRDYHKYNRTDDRDRKYDKHGDNRYKRENYFDKKDDKRDYYRRNDHDRNWNSGHWDRDDYKHRKDKYSTSPRRGEERRKSDGKESRSRDPRLRERDSESSEGRDFHSKDPRDRDERDGRDNRCRDPRLRGRNVENSDANSRDKKAKEWCGDSETAESRDSMSKDSSCRDNESKSLSARNMSGKDFGAKVGENDNSKLKARDPRLQEKVNGNDSIYHLERRKSLDSKDNVNKQRENCESEDRGSEWTSKVASFDEEQCTSVENQSDSQLQSLTSTEVTTAETVSTFAASTPSAEIRPLNKYSEEAYTIGVDACSDEEEPLPPGYERDVAHEVQLEITRNKIKAAQNAVKKRKLSETVQEEKQDGGSKAKKIQIVLKSAQFNSTETAHGCLSSSDTLVKGEECEEVQGGWRCVSLVSTDKSTPEVAADVAISSSEADDSTVALVNLPLTEDISPCNSPALEETVQVECNDNSESSKPPNEPLTNDLYSDIEANDDDNDVGNGVDVDDDDAMSLSSISSNEDTLEVNKPDETPMLKPKPITVPPPGVVFHPYPPPLFNPRLPPPLLFNPMVPPPPLGPVRVPPPPIPSVPSVPPPTIRPPTLPPPSIPPPSVPPPSVPPIPVPPVPIPPPVLGGPPGFFDKRVPPPFPGGSYPNSAGFGYQKVEQKKPWRSRIIDEVYRVVYSELDMVLTRDIFKKLVEASAFKALESWWDNQTKPKTSPATATTSSRNLPMYQHHPPATVGLPSNSGNVASTIGPSPFERPSSMVLGLRASLPKLPSFKVKRPPEPPKSETVDSLVRKRSNTESPVMHEQEVKKRCVDDGEADSEMDTDLESSWDRKPRTVSRVEEEERSQSPWQHLDDSMDVAPPATRVRTTEADERRPSTGSSLYHTLYSSGSSSTESESEESASDEEEEEEEEESEEESDESDSDEESESDSEQEEKRHEEQKVDVVMDVDEHIEENQEEAQARVEEKQAIKQQSSSESSTSLPSPSWKNEVALPSVKQEPDRTVETRTLPNLTSSQVERTAPTEQFRSFHIANIVPDLFKNQENTSDTTLGRDSNKTLDKDQIDRTEREPESNETIIKTEPVLEDITAENLTAESETDANNLSSLQDTNTTTTLEQSLEIPEVKTPICAPEFGLQDKEASKPPNLQLSVDAKPDLTDELDINQSNGMFDERMPLLSPDKPLAVSLIELDHSYGLVIPQEPPTPQEEPEVFEPPLPSDKRFTESPVLDVVSVDSVAPMLPLPDLSPPKPQFPVRSFEADDELVLEFHRLGVDAEDAYYLKVGFEQLQQVGSESVLDAHWSNHPPTAQPTLTKRRKQKAEHGVRVHVTGCARAEGFYKIDINEKAKYLQSQRRQLQCQAYVNKEEQKTDGNKAKQQSREHRAIQRRLQSAVFNEEFGDLLKFNQLMVRKKQLRFAKSGIHDWGLFALESIAADEMVTEYVGEVIRQPMADIRERRYEESGIGSSYLFRVDQDTIIDATTKGNLARFINHCCDPNCYAKIVTLENAKKIVIYSKRDIAVNDEITYDYKFPIEDEKIPCLCGVAQCRGTLN